MTIVFSKAENGSALKPLMLVSTLVRHKKNKYSLTLNAMQDGQEIEFSNLTIRTMAITIASIT